MSIRSIFCLFLIITPLWSLQGCSNLYFHDAGAARPIAYSIEEWPYDEYWTGIVFNGEKIGFTHLQIEPQSNGFTINSEAVVHFRFLGISKEIALRSTDHVTADLQLVSFEYDYRIDQSHLVLSGRREAEDLIVNISQDDQSEMRRFPLIGKLYPTSAIALYPPLHGLDIGNHYSYQVFDGETLTITPVEQQVEAYERSELFTGAAYRVVTTMLDQSVSTWFDARARPVFELSSGGVIISALESEERAREYLSQAVLSKKELLVDYSLIKSSHPIASPREVQQLQLRLSGIPENFELVDRPHQRCTREKGDAYLCEIVRAKYTEGSSNNNPTQPDPIYLKSTLQAPSIHPTIKSLAQEIGADQYTAKQQVESLLSWIEQNITREAIDSFSALDVLKQRSGECQGNSYLFTALARSLNIPTRVVNGLVYSEDHHGFLYHTWVESWIYGNWIPIDPTFNQKSADATHITLLEGEEFATLSKLTPLIGQLKSELIAINHKSVTGF